MTTTTTTKSFLTENQVEFIKEVEMDALSMLDNGFSVSETHEYLNDNYGEVLPYELVRMILNSAENLVSE